MPIDLKRFQLKQRAYTTDHGVQLVGDSRVLLAQLEPESVDLIMTSPPFALQRKKEYGNETQAAYVDWLATFGVAAQRVLKPTGSLVIDIGGAYNKGVPTRSLYPYRVLLRFCDDLGFHLAEDFFWYNPAKLPSPIEWVNKRKIRVKDAVNTVWWFSKAEFPKADVNRVLNAYSARMETLLRDPAGFYDAKTRPSEHAISTKFATNNGGSIPSNMLQIANTDSNSHYLRTCRLLGLPSHPARFPPELPRFFIKYLTEPGDVVVDIFSGSNTTGKVAQDEGRKWVSMEEDRQYASLSAIRFLDGLPAEKVRKLYDRMVAGQCVNL